MAKKGILSAVRNRFSRTGKSAATRAGYAYALPFTGSKLKGSLPSYLSKYALDHDALRAVSRRNYFESTQARGIIGRLSENSVGTGLKLSCTPTWELVEPSWNDAQKQHFSRDVELRFFLWAQSHEPDAAGRRTFGELQEHEFKNRMKDGETFAILRYSADSSRISPLSIQFINPDQICTSAAMLGSAKPDGAIVQNGIELDKQGRELAVYVMDADSRAVTRIPFRGSGRTFVLHPAITEEIGQVRGVSPVAMIAHELSKLTDYSVAEVEAAVNNAIIAGYIKPSPDANSSSPLAAAAAVQHTGSADGSPTKVDKAGFWIQNLKAGEDLQSFDTKRPNVNFGGFVDTVSAYLCASLNVPLEIVKMMFAQNYSASRAALILYWQTVEGWRASLVSQFLQPVYEAWFSEEVRAGRIIAPGFGESPVITAAWLTADWIGSSLPSIDPYKEAQADGLRIAQGATTYERNALKYNGSDFRDNCDKLRKESELLPTPSAATPGVDASETERQPEDIHG